MEHSLENCLDRIIRERTLSALFQPIVSSAQRQIIGYEALIRGPSDSPLHSPVTLFDTASRNGRLLELELLCREVSIQQFCHLKLPGKLFLNTSPEALFQPNFRSGCTLEMLHEAKLPPERVVIELTEQYPMENYSLIREAKQHYKKMGFEIAIDDLGAGYAGLRMWSELRPDYVKIDRHFMQDIHEDLVKQEFVRSIQDIARHLKCRVIAEGVETADELRTVYKLGLDLLQGYYFARPSHSPPIQIDTQLFSSNQAEQGRRGRLGMFSRTVGELLQPVPSIVATLPLDSVAEIFACAPHLESLPIVEHGRPMGLVRRGKLMNLLLTRYGRELHGKKPIASFLQSRVLTLESALPIEKASHLVTEQMKQDKALDFMITENGQYRGMGSVIDLLQIITDMQVRNARYANPLTLLPGNVPIYEELDELLQRKRPFVFAYCDLDNFKPYNDKYGYEKGDQVIKLVAEIILAETDPETDFVGHVGGDDFIIILQGEQWQVRCERILFHFAERRQRYYQQDDLEAGGFWSQDRSGENRFFPLLSLSIGCVQPDLHACRSHHDVAALAAGAKHQAKKQLGNSLFIDQRCRPECATPRDEVA